MNDLIKFYTRGPMKGLAGRTLEIQLVEANVQETMSFLDEFFESLLRKRRITSGNLFSVVRNSVDSGNKVLFRKAEVHGYYKNGLTDFSYALLRDWAHVEHDLSASGQRFVIAEAIRTNGYITFLYGEEELPYHGRPTMLRENGFQLRHSGGYRNYRFESVEELRATSVRSRSDNLSDLHLNGVLSSPVIKLRFDDEGSGSALVRLAYADKTPPEYVREWSYERIKQNLHWVPVESPIYESYVAESRALWQM